METYIPIYHGNLHTYIPKYQVDTNKDSHLKYKVQTLSSSAPPHCMTLLNCCLDSSSHDKIDDRLVLIEIRGSSEPIVPRRLKGYMF